MTDIVRKQEDHYVKQEMKKTKLIKDRSSLLQTIHSLLEGLQLSVDRGDQMLFSDRNGSNPRPCCNNKMLQLRHIMYSTISSTY